MRKRRMKHGDAQKGKVLPFYSVWLTMKDRCLNKKNKDYHNYGGRGISVSDLWKKYVNFKQDMYTSYLLHKEKNNTGTTLERIDNNTGYSKENCRWATAPEQQKNTRQNREITSGGMTKIVADWARELNVPPIALYKRMYRGWSDNDIITRKLGVSRVRDKKGRYVNN